jgi:hypothetical protein
MQFGTFTVGDVTADPTEVIAETPAQTVSATASAR